MLCCVGLIGGSVVGQAMGGPWTFIGPAAGFGIGLVADMKIMKGFHRKADAEPETPKQGAPAAPATESSAGCGIASGLMRMLGMKEPKANGEMTLAQIRATYQTASSAQPLAAEVTADTPAVEKGEPG